MRRILYFTFFLLSLQAAAQQQQWLGAPNTTVINRGHLRTDSTFQNALRDTNFAPARLGIQVFRQADLSLYYSISTTTRPYWAKVGSGTGGNGTICTESEGSGIVWDDSLNYYVTAWPQYCINGAVYSFAGGTVTLTSDPDNPMFYAIALTTAGTVTAIAGTPSEAASTPYVDPALYRLVGYVYVPEGATEAVNIQQGIIYNEGAEWATGTIGTISANFLSPTFSVAGTYGIAVSSYNGGSLTFTNNATVSASSYQTLSLWLRLTATMANNRNVIVQFFNGTTAVSNAVTLNVNKATVNAWQLVSVNIGAFSFTNTNFDRVYITFSGSGTAPLYIDYIQLQNAGVTVAPATGTTNAYTRIIAGGNTVNAIGSDGLTVESADPNRLGVSVTRDATKGPTLTLRPVWHQLTQDSIQGLKPALDSITTYYYRNDSLFGLNRYGVEILVYAQPKIRPALDQFDIIEVSDGDSLRIKSSILGGGGGSGLAYPYTANRYLNGYGNFPTLNTDSIQEGSTNLFYTNARVRAALSASTGISYDNTTGIISSTVTQYTDAQARASISLTTTGQFPATYNSTTGALNIPNPNTTQTLTDGTTVTFDVSLGRSAMVTLGGNRTLSITNFNNGEFLSLLIIQDATGSRTLTLPASVKVINGGAGAVTLSTAASSQDILTFWKINNVVYCNYGKNYN